MIVQELKYEAELVRVAPELDGDSIVQRYVSRNCSYTFSVHMYTQEFTCIANLCMSTTRKTWVPVIVSMTRANDRCVSYVLFAIIMLDIIMHHGLVKG